MNSVLCVSQWTFKFSGWPWKDAPCGRMERGGKCNSSTLTMYRSAISSNRSIFSRLADLKEMYQTVYTFTLAVYFTAIYNKIINVCNMIQTTSKKDITNDVIQIINREINNATEY